MSMLTVEECELLTDSKYRSYISQVDKALRSFEYTSEWADLISALGKLNKVLLSHLKYPVIPKKVTIGKRLAQCLHPALPSGVHLKALETYDIIFKCIGTQRLAHDLFIYTAGLFPLLGHASMSVKPVLLTVYEKHFVALGRHIKPGLNGLLLGLLPGLEEGAESFDRANLLLEDFSDAAGPPFFYTAIWQCMASCPSVRLSGITYLLSHLNKLQSMEDQLHMIGLEIDLMISGICACLQDTSVLVQRSMLDFILIAFPMHNNQLTKADLGKTLEAAVNVVLRRDMSLNRRLYAWLLGTTTTATSATLGMDAESRERTSSTSTTDAYNDYFQIYSKDLLVGALKSKLHIDYCGLHKSLLDGPSPILKPFRILISLLDKPEIGPVIIENVLLSVFRALKEEGDHFTTVAKPTLNSSQSPNENRIPLETLKTANLLFSSFETYFLWDFIGRLFSSMCDLKSQGGRGSVSGEIHMEVISIIELCDLVEFLLDILALDVYPETSTEHIPELLHQVTISLTSACSSLTDLEINRVLKLCSKLFSHVQPSISGFGANRSQSVDVGDNISVFSNSDLATSGGVKSGFEHSIDINNSSSSNNVGGDDNATVSSSSRSVQNGTVKTSESFEHGFVVKEHHFGNSEESSDASGEFVVKDSSSVNVNSSALTNGFHHKDNMPYNDVRQLRTQGSVSSSMSLNTKKALSGHINLMQLCVKSFQEFFHCFTHLHILKCDQFYNESMNKISTKPNHPESTFCAPPVHSNTNAKRNSLKGKTNANQAGAEDSDISASSKFGSGKKIEIGDSVEVKKAFQQACRLLVDFASFPIYCIDYQTIIEEMMNNKEETTALPPWLQDILVCSCYVSCFNIQYASINTILDLIVLTQSVQSESESKTRFHGLRSIAEGRVSVVILPALLPIHLDYINQETRFYEVIARELWSSLGGSNSNHQKAVALLHTLHQVTPNSNLCEDVIGQDLISELEDVRISAFKKFNVLWHLTRSIRSEPNPIHSPRTFDRSMFVVLDSLKEETSITKNVALTWLTHVIQRGDTSRVLLPLLLMLLHPDTARVSVQHINVHKPRKISSSEDKDEDDDMENKIYAISSHGGNVIYHVSQDKTKRTSKSSTDLKSYAMSVVADKGATSTAPVRTHSVTDLSFERVDPDDVKLRVNPFGSANSLDKLIFDGYDFPHSSSLPDLKGIKRLNKDTCRKEGILFDINDDIENVMAGSDSSNSIEPDEKPSPQSQGNSSDDMKQDNSSRDRKDSEMKSEVELLPDSDKPEDIALWVVKHLIDEVVRRVDGTTNDIDCNSTAAGIRITNTLGESSTDSLTGEDSSDSPIIFDHRRLDPSRDIHELHMHILLYCQQYDFRRTIYALSTIRAMLLACPRLVVTAMATTSISSVRPPHLAKLQSLLGRHRKSVFGKNFFGDLPPDVLSNYRSNMFVEIVISLCLYFVRGYYPNLMSGRVTQEELLGNKMVHILGVEILTLVVSELLSIMKDSGKSFVSYIQDLLYRCKIQKSLLHCMLACVYNQGQRPGPSNSTTTTNNTTGNTTNNQGGHTNNNTKNNSSNNNNNNAKDHRNNVKPKRAAKLTEAIVDFNENDLDAGVNDTFEMKLLQLMLVMIMLEDQIETVNGRNDNTTQQTLGASVEFSKVHLTSSLVNAHYTPNRPIIQQEMFLSAVWSALKQHHQSHLHRHWVALVTSGLPYMGKAMARTVLCVVLQLCRNLETVAADFRKNRTSLQPIPPDYVLTLLEGLITLCHYCLLDNVSPVGIGQPAPTATHISTETASAGQILTNLIHVFNPASNSKETSPARDSGPMSPVMEARNHILGILPRIMTCMASLWKAVSQGLEEADTVHPVFGDFKEVKQHILELLSPISLPHGTHLLAAFAVAWNDRREKPSPTASSSRKSSTHHTPCEDQMLLVELVAAIKVLPTDTLIQTVKQVIKSPPNTELTKKNLSLEVNLLQFFFAYVKSMASVSQLMDSWPSLLSLLRECLQMNLTPPAQFLILQILNEYVQKIPPVEEKKGQKDLQDICQKTLESTSSIAGSSLEQTTWLRRSFAVKPGPQNEGEEEADGVEEEEERKEELKKSVVKVPNLRSPASDSKHSVHALALLAELTAPLLDMIYTSEEKDKVAQFLSTLLLNVFPYLRHHSSHNLPSYRACSQMLSSISDYQYTRRAWRKEAFEMMLESAFFQMDVTSIRYWRTVIDNLMTHDKTTFKDLMGRVSITQSGSLNLFNSKEQEYEQRAQMIKRLAFIIFCSESDQYQRAMPDIQERLSECLRLPPVATILSQVFLCFRVLLLRMSPQHLTSLWPTIITETVQVLLQIEQELSTDTDEFKTQIQRIAALDSNWAHLSNGLNAHNNPAWLHLYLNVCKLLDMCLLLPADTVPQFQLYRWAFIGTAGEEDGVSSSKPSNNNGEDKTFGGQGSIFTPHIIRLSRLISRKMRTKPNLIPTPSGYPLLTMHNLHSLAELQPFFYTICHQLQHEQQQQQQAAGSRDAKPGPTKISPTGPASTTTTSHKSQQRHSKNLSEFSSGQMSSDGVLMSSKECVEKILENDFLEKLS